MTDVTTTCEDNDAKRLKLDIEKSSEESPSVDGENIGNGYSDEVDGSTTWFVRNVDRKSSEREIADFFSKFGPVKDVHRGHKCQTTAFVTFDDVVNFDFVDRDLLLFKNRYLVIKNSNGKKDIDITDIKDCVEDHHVRVSPHIHVLPDEVLQLVFSYLTVPERFRTESVCKRWRTIGKKLPWIGPSILDLGEKFFLDRTFILSGKKKLTNKVVSSVLSRCGNSVRELAVFRTNGFTDKVLEFIGKFCPNLVALELNGFHTKRGVTTNKSPLLNLARQCQKLRKVSLACFILTDAHLQNFMEMLPQLERLELKTAFDLEGECFVKAKEASKRLKAVRLERCRYSHAILNRLKNANSTLEELGLVFCLIPFETLSDVCSHYQNTLKVLHLDGLSNISERTQFLTALPNLEELSLDRCPDVDDRMLQSLATKCDKLRVLVVSATKITDVGVAGLSAAPRLKVVDISYTRVAGGGIDNLAAHGQLEELYVRRLPKWANDIELGCLALVKHCAKLRILDVSANQKITSKLVEEFQLAVKKKKFQAHTVKLVVGDTSVQENDIQRCDGLCVVFESSSRSELSDDGSSDDLYSDEDDNDDDSDYDSDDSRYRDAGGIADFFGFLNYMA